MFHLMNLQEYLTYLKDSLEVRDSSDVPGRFVNLYLMVIMVAL